LVLKELKRKTVKVRCYCRICNRYNLVSFTAW